MKKIEAAKKQYDNLSVPEELSVRVMQEIGRAGKQRDSRAVYRKKHGYQWAAVAAAVTVIFTAGLNTSETFAHNIENVPIIGIIAKVLTFREYTKKTEEVQIRVEIPSIEMIAADNEGTTDQINEEIHAFCEQYANEATARALAYRQAFLETGGTEDEWRAHEVEIVVSYEVKAHTQHYLSVAIEGTESWSASYGQTCYYNFDLETGRVISLSDFLGADGMKFAEESIRAQASSRDGYWADDWNGIREDVRFYINEQENPVIVLDMYEIAPRAMGEPEFELVK